MSKHGTKKGLLGVLKRRAKRLARELGIPHHAALDHAARAGGFPNYQRARIALESLNDPAP